MGATGSSALHMYCWRKDPAAAGTLIFDKYTACDTCLGTPPEAGPCLAAHQTTCLPSCLRRLPLQLLPPPLLAGSVACCVGRGALERLRLRCQQHSEAVQEELIVQPWTWRGRCWSPFR